MDTFREMRCGDGVVRLDAAHQGRVFAWLDGERLHRWDQAVAENPSETDFNNLGGNSLWPAPEGGPYAFNYPADEWLVQPGVNTAPSELAESGMSCRRTVPLRNHHGTSLQVTFERRMEGLGDDIAAYAGYGLRFTGYREKDALTFSAPVAEGEAVVSAWSLEQFPNPEGVIAFGCVEGDAAAAMNTDFYGDPGRTLRCDGHWFRFDLGGPEKFQIGLSASQRPRLVGAFVPSRRLLITRTCLQTAGKYINFADNEQPDGVFSADDQMSLFNGAPLGFFELETLGPVEYDDEGRVTGSHLTAESRFWRGENDALRRFAQGGLGLPKWILD